MVFVSIAAVGAVGVPVKFGDSSGAFNDKEFVTVEAKFASLSNAVANSFNVSKAESAPDIKLFICVFTNSVVATLELLSFEFCVTAVKLPITFTFFFNITFPSTVKLLFKETSFINFFFPFIFWSFVVFTTSLAVIFSNFVSFSILVNIEILLPSTKVILSKPFAIKLPTVPDAT